jgi:hypothetical protein
LTLEIIYGADPRERLGAAVFQASILQHASQPVAFIPLHEPALRASQLYRRPHERRGNQLWCPISDAPMSTDFANSRFLVPWLARGPWALFCDGADMLARADIAELFSLADDRYALMAVQHRHEPTAPVKMDGQFQSRYQRKNWSSLMLWNLADPAHKKLTLDAVNKLPGRELHRFCWLKDEEIGALPTEWNFLVGVQSMPEADVKLAHFTNGTPEVGVHDDRWWSRLWLDEATGVRIAA